jgi:hypothetical protein
MDRVNPFDIKIIKGEYGYVWLHLPIGFSRDSEYKGFIKEISELYPNNEIREHNDTVRVDVNKGHIEDKWVTTFIRHKENAVEIGANRYGEIDMMQLDTILRETVVGKKLKKHWSEKYSISEQEAQKLLEKLTPNAENVSPRNNSEVGISPK